MSDYWTSDPRSVSPDLLQNAVYWDSDSANTVYSTGSSSNKQTSASKSSSGSSSASKQTSGSSSASKHTTNRVKTSNKSEKQPTVPSDESAKVESSSSDSKNGSRDPRRRKRPSKPPQISIPCKQRQLPPDRPDTITVDNIHLHRLPHENSHEWGIRRRFLLEHCESVDSSMLECLSQVFINTECHGSTYPSAVMKRVREMASFLDSDLKRIRAEKRARNEVKFVKESQPKAESKPRMKSDFKKPIAFVKPNAVEVIEDTTNDPESVIEESSQRSSTGKKAVVDKPKANLKRVAPETSSSHFPDKKPKSTLKHDNPETSSSSRTQNVQQREGTSPGNKLANFYKLANVYSEIDKTKKSDNVIQTLHMAADKMSMQLEIDFCLSSKSKFQTCQILYDSVLIGNGQNNKKRLAKHAAFEDAVNRLKKPYLNIVRVNPERQELEASDKPFHDSTSPSSELAVLGGGEVARRGMKPSQKVPHKLDKDNFILVNYTLRPSNDAAVILQTSADLNKVHINWQFHTNKDNTYTCKLFLEHEEFDSFTAATSKLAKINVAEAALERLQKTCWTILVKGADDACSMSLSRDEILGEIDTETGGLPDTNIGSKMMKKMGWSGGGIGKDGQGISEPVQANTILMRRQGFGLSSAQGVKSDFKSKVKSLLMDYCKSAREDDFKFSPEFTNHERAFIHAEASKLGLRTKSYGRGDERYLIVSRKRSPAQLLAFLKGLPRKHSKYDLVAPSCTE